MPDLCTLSDVKNLLEPAKAGVPGPNDAMIAKLITAASAYFLTITNRAGLLAASYTETRDGDESSSLILRNTPLLSVESLTISGTPWIAYAGSGQGFAVADNGFEVVLIGGRLQRGVRNVVVTYTAGWNSVPAEVNQAVCEMVLWKKAKMPRIDTSSQTLQGAETISYNQGDVPPSIRGVVKNYTNLGGFRGR